MAKLLVFTDLHLKEPGGRIIGLDPIARFEAARNAALDAHADADLAILMGDLTHSGKPEEYAALQEALAPFPMPVIPMLGNHDNRAHFSAAFPDAPDGAGFVQAVRDVGDVRVITMDTLDEPRVLETDHAGRLCPDRLAYLDHALATAGDRMVLLFLHHPPHPVGFPAMDAIRLDAGTALIDRLARHKRLHLFCGHVHRTISGSIGSVPFTLFKSPCHQMPFDLRGQDSTASTDEPGAYGLLLADAEGVIAHSEDVGLGAHRFSGKDALPES